MADINALVRNPLVLGGAAVVVVAAALAGGYFLGRGSGSSGSATVATTKEALANRSVCQATLARVRNFGIVEQNATLVSDDAQNTDTKNRYICSAKSGANTYSITVDSSCGDMSDAKCLQLYTVSDASGTIIYRRTHFLDPE